MTPYQREQWKNRVIVAFWALVGYGALWFLFASTGFLAGCAYPQHHPKMTPWDLCLKNEIRRDAGIVYRCTGSGWEIIGQEKGLGN